METNVYYLVIAEAHSSADLTRGMSGEHPTKSRGIKICMKFLIFTILTPKKMSSLTSLNLQFYLLHPCLEIKDLMQSL